MSLLCSLGLLMLPVYAGPDVLTAVFANQTQARADISNYAVFADSDADGDVDQVDFGVFQRCLTLPPASVDLECQVYDRNGDDLVNAQDLEAFQLCQSGPAVPANPACERWPSGLASDDFNSFNLDGEIWSIIDPLGDAEVAIVGTNSGNALLSVKLPSGLSHSMWTHVMNGPQFLQEAQDTDFQLEAKFESVVDERFENQGFLVKQDADTFLMLEVYSDGLNVYYFAGLIDNGSATTYQNAVISGGTPAYLRITRHGDQFTALYSFDGDTWTSSVQFTEAIQVTQVGLFASTSENETTPAFEMLVDYFVNTAAPFCIGDEEIVQDSLAPNFVHLETVPDGDKIGIRWSTDEPTSATVEYGLTEAYELGTITDPALSQRHFEQIAGLATATYHLRITATDSAANSSQRTTTVVTGQPSPGPAITVWYGDIQEFGHWGVPQPAADVLGNVQDPDGVAWLGYSLNGGPPVILSRGPNSMRLAQTGDFVADLSYQDLLAGSNQLLLRAVDGLGNVRHKHVTVINSAGATWPLPYAIDWSQAASINSVAQVVDGLWTLAGGTVRPAVSAYDRLIAIGDVSWQNYEVSVPITVHSVGPGGYDPPSNGPAVGIVCRWPGHSDDGSQPLQGVYPLGGIGLYRWTTTANRYQIFGNNGFILAQASTSDVLQLGVNYVFKVRVQTTGSNVSYRLKVWLANQPEPVDWKLSGHQSNANDPGQGSVLLLAHHVDASFGNVTITPGPFP